MCEMDDQITAETPKRKLSPIKLDDIYDQNIDLKNDLRSLVSAINNIQQVQQDTNNQVGVIKSDVKKIKEKQSVNDIRLNILEQNNLSSLMEIKGVEKKSLEKINDLKGYLINLFASYDFVCSEGQIEYAYVKEVKSKGGQVSVIIVKFINEVIKKNLMINKFKKKDERKLFFNHVLTSYNRALLGKAKSVGKELNLPMVSFRDGKVHMRKDRESRSIIIRSFNDFEELSTRSEKNAETVNETANNNGNPAAGSRVGNTPVIQPATLTHNHKVESMSNMTPKKVSESDLSIFQLNVRGWNDFTNFTLFKSLLECAKITPDVIVLTEVKLKPSFPIGIYNLKGYSIFHALRDSKFSKGGVLVYVKDNIPHNLISSSSSDFEKILITLHLLHRDISIICSYRPQIYRISWKNWKSTSVQIMTGKSSLVTSTSTAKEGTQKQRNT